MLRVLMAVMIVAGTALAFAAAALGMAAIGLYVLGLDGEGWQLLVRIATFVGVLAILSLLDWFFLRLFVGRAYAREP